MISLPINMDLALFTLRLALATIYLVHGPTKIFDTRKISKKIGLSSSIVLIIGIVEVASAILLILGIQNQWAGLALVVTALIAIYLKSQKQDKDFTGASGWELEFMLLAGALTIFLAGSGAFTIL